MADTGTPQPRIMDEWSDILGVPVSDRLRVSPQRVMPAGRRVEHPAGALRRARAGMNALDACAVAVTIVDTVPRMTVTGWRHEHLLVGTRHFCLRSFPGSPWLAMGVIYEADMHGQPLNKPPLFKESSRRAAFEALVAWMSR